MDNDTLYDLVEQFVKEYYPSGVYTMYADYRDELSDDQIEDILNSSDPMSRFYELLWDAYTDYEFDVRGEIEEEFLSWCQSSGYENIEEIYDSSVIDDAIMDAISIEPEYDHYLKQDIKCRLIVNNGDATYSFTRNPNQDNEFQILSGAGIIWLGQELGYSVEDMQNALNEGLNSEADVIDDSTNPDKFLDSLVHETANAYGCPMLTFLCKLTLDDLIKFRENPSSVKVTLNNANCGFFDGYNGGGSVLELECGVKSITIPADKIYQLVPDVDGFGMYSVDDVYGLVGWVYDDATLV